MNLAWSIVAGLVIAAISLLLGYDAGYDSGALAVQAEHDRTEVVSLGTRLNQVADDIQQSRAASKAMREALARIEVADKTSTKEQKNALAKTARERVLCSFDADSMRLITAAADAADQRAAGGIRGAVSAGDPANRQQP